LLYGNADLVIGLAELDCVADQINENLLAAHFVDLNFHFWHVALKDEADLLCLSLGRKNVNHRLDNLRLQVLRAQLDLQLVLVQQTHVQVCLHLVEQEAGRVENDSKVKGERRVLDTAEKAVCHLNNASDWRKHFVVAAGAQKLD
jgi:hypothetical protein